MTSVSKNVYTDQVDDIVNKYYTHTQHTHTHTHTHTHIYIYYYTNILLHKYIYLINIPDFWRFKLSVCFLHPHSSSI